MAARKSECEEFARYNALCPSGGIVLFGASFAAELPLNELAQDLGVEERLYNRSIRGLTVGEAREYLKDCVEDLAPRKVFINIGDADLETPDFDQARFVAEYEWLLYQIHTSVPGVRLYVVSVCSQDPRAASLNRALRTLAEKSGCHYLDVSRCVFQTNGKIKMFRALRSFLRAEPMTFADAMRLC